MRGYWVDEDLVLCWIPLALIFSLALFLCACFLWWWTEASLKENGWCSKLHSTNKNDSGGGEWTGWGRQHCYYYLGDCPMVAYSFLLYSGRVVQLVSTVQFVQFFWNVGFDFRFVLHVFCACDRWCLWLHNGLLVNEASERSQVALFMCSTSSYTYMGTVGSWKTRPWPAMSVVWQLIILSWN